MIGNTNQPINEASTKFGSSKYRLILVRFRDELDVDNFAKAVNATISQVPLLSGKKMHYLDCSVGSVIPSAASAGTIAPQGTITIAATIEGISKSTLGWLYENNGEYFLVIWENCKTGQRFIGGGPCGGLKLTYKSLGIQNKGEWQGAEIEFKGDQCPDPFNFYDGNIVLEDPAVVTITDGKFAIGTGSQYQLPDGGTAVQTLTDITGITDADVGRIIDLRGAGLNFPVKISASAKFILQNGVDFNASNNTSISFQIAKTGASAYAFYEVARS
jgi:hypothetical protein